MNIQNTQIKKVCNNNKFSSLLPYVGDLTFLDVVETLSTTPLPDVVNSVFPENVRFTAFVFLNSIRYRKIKIEPPTNASELDYSKMIDPKAGIPVAQVCTDIKTNSKTLRALSVSNNNLLPDDVKSILQALLENVQENQLSAVNFAGNDFKFTQDLLQDLSVRMVADGKIAVSKTQLDKSPEELRLCVELVVL